MLLGLDHATIAVRDLEVASDQLGQALGLRFSLGNEYPALGTISSIAPFSTNYLELITIGKPDRARDSIHGRILLNLLSQRAATLLGFGITSDDLERDVIEARSRGLPLEGPFHGNARRPDGTFLTWRSAEVPTDPWGHELPFLIQPISGMLQRRHVVAFNHHHLKAHTIRSLALAIEKLDNAIESYRLLLGEPPDTVEDVPQLSARRAFFCVGSFRIALLQPTEAGSPLADTLLTRGNGVFQIGLGVPNLDEAISFLSERGTSIGDPTPWGTVPLSDPSQTLGISFQLEEVAA